jgi:uncharacterized protein (DUF433 family)
VQLPTYENGEVIVDPKVAFGLPLVVHGGARVEDLVDRFQAGDSVADIAADFSVPRDQVEDVIRVATRAAACAERDAMIDAAVRVFCLTTAQLRGAEQTEQPPV